MKDFFLVYRKIFIAILILPIIASLFYFNAKRISDIKQHNEWVISTYEVISQSKELFEAIANSEDIYREYTITGNDKLLKEYYEKSGKNKHSFTELKNLVPEEKQRLRLDTIERLYHLKSLTIDSAISNYHNSKDIPLFTSPYKDALNDSIQTVINNFNLYEKTLLKNESESASSAGQTVSVYMLLSTAALLIIFVIIYIGLIRQAGKKEKSERELFIQTEWYNKTLMSIGDAVIATDKNGIITFINKAGEEITEWTTSETIGRHVDFVFQIYQEATGKIAENPLKKALTEGKIFLLSNHTQLKTKSGKMIFIDDSAAPIFDDKNQIVGGVLIFRDIHEKTVSLKLLAEEKQKLKEIIDNNTATISIRDLEGRYTLVNKHFEKITGDKRENIYGKKVHEVFTDPGLIKNLTAADKKILSDKHVDRYEQTFVHPDGSINFYVVTRFPILDLNGNVISICTMASDITQEKKRIEEEIRTNYLAHLKKSEQKFAELVENMPVMYFTMDKDLKFLFWNKASEEFTNIKSGDCEGKSLNELFPDDIIPIEVHCREILITQKTKSFILDYTLFGKSYVADVTLYPTSYGIAGMADDITEQRYAENATVELIESLQKRNNDLKQFAYIVSHNLRAPISKIQALASLYNTEQSDESFNQTLTENINAGVNELDIVVKDINTVISSGDTEKAEYEYTLFEVELNLVKQILTDDIKRAGNAVITSSFHEPAGISTIKSYLHSIFLNLISNAIKFRSKERNLHIHFSTTQNDHYISIVVEDNGAGINLDKYGKKIFGLYKRFHGNDIEGRGLGLYLVKTQVEAMKGKIEVESELNRGTKFTISLPKKNN